MHERIRRQHRSALPHAAFDDVARDVIADEVFDRLIERPRRLHARGERQRALPHGLDDVGEERIRNVEVFERLFASGEGEHASCAHRVSSARNMRGRN
jgi:hypothetical protein